MRRPSHCRQPLRGRPRTATYGAAPHRPRDGDGCANTREVHDTPVLTNPPPSAQPIESPQATPGPAWQVETLLVAPGEPGRLYALMKDSSGPLWAFPASNVRLMISDDYAVTWAPFPGGLPVPAACMVNVNLDYAATDALYASTCQGLYVWDVDGKTWVKRSDRLTDAVAVAFGQPNNVWAAAHGDGVIRSTDGGRTWQDASTGLTTFGGMANLGFDPRQQHALRDHPAEVRRQLPAPGHAGRPLADDAHAAGQCHHRDRHDDRRRDRRALRDDPGPAGRALAVAQSERR